MGLFDKGETEIRIEEEKKLLKKLESNIKAPGKLSTSCQKQLISYLSDVKNNKKINDFFDADFLFRVFIQFVSDDFNDQELLSNHLYKVINAVHELLPAGEKTPNYEFIKEMIINNFVDFNGYINKNIYRPEFYALFNDINDYLDVMNIISANNLLTINFEVINKYACQVSKYCTSTEIFKNDLISFLHGFSDVVDGDYYKYIVDSLIEAKKRIGVYSIDQGTLAVANSNVEKVESYLDTIREYQSSLELEKASIESLVSVSKEELSKYSKKAIAELKQLLEKEKAILLTKLDEYLLELEQTLRDKSDTVFQEILSNYQKQIRDFRTMFQSYSKAATEDLLRLQKATEESIERLQNYVMNDKQLQELLGRAAENAAVQARLISIVEKGEKIMEAVPETGAEKEIVRPIVIPGNERIVLPASPQVIIPDNTTVDTTLLSSFDETVPFEKRMNNILKLMREKEKQGEIFHEMTEEVIRCIIEGDWPYLWGPSGCGKSYLIQQVSELLGLPLVKNGKITEPYTVMGYNDPQGKFRATQTYIAAKYGKLLAFDEFDNGNPDTQVVLNEVYTALIETLEHPDKNQYITFAEDLVVPVNPNFRMISAGNTTGEGESPVYSSRSKIDESVQQRMTPKFVNYDNRVEKKIFGSYNEWYNFFVSFREACDKYAESHGLDSAIGIGTTRDAAAICKYIRNNSKTLDQVIAEKFIQTKSQEYLEELGRYIANKYNIDYGNASDVTQDKKLVSCDEKILARKFVYKCKRGIR